MSLTNALHIRIARLLVRKAVLINENIQLTTLYQLRIQFDLPLVGEDEAIDKELSKTVSDFYNWSSYSVDSCSTDVPTVYSHWLTRDEDSNSLREVSFRIAHWLETSITKLNDIEKTFRSIYHHDLVPIESSDLRKLHTKIQRNRDSIYRLLKEHKSHKIDIRLKDLVMIIPLISAMLVCAGYLHTSLVYKHFDIDPTRFFSVGDYLAASLEQIRHAFIAMIAYVAGVIHGYREQSTATRYEKNLSARRARREDIILCVLGSLALLAAYIRWDVIGTIPQIHMFLVLVLLMTIQGPLHFLSNRYFTNSRSVYIVSGVLLIFLGSMFIGAKSRVVYIESGKDEQAYEIITQQEIYTRANSSIIGANSKFLFILEPNNKVTIVPLKAINLIKHK